ncbi:polysaccharide deacetylase family protein [Sphingomonas baiyangensis]|uniref:polysaccharide deacetylase family protein n=1 Tax=Sphingomonas baiyangensis TaxID=2572576 RepID=UPI00146CB5B3|nr:polysaccharide deacetylase family protein [Sphingomonas baiyangensis]
MTRKAERRARLLRWASIVLAGTLAALVAGWLLAGGWIVGLAIVAVALGIAHRAMIAPSGTAILTYHSVDPEPRWLPWGREIAVHPATFATHMATLARMGDAVLPTREWVARRQAGAPVPARCVLLHLDDGYRDNLVHAAPVLAHHGFAATIFPSLDFIEPGTTTRPAPTGACEGYLNWPELAVLAQQGIEIEPHGVAHARVPVSERATGTLDAQNWRANAWMQWAATPGPKHDWFRHAAPQAVPLGSPIPESGLALAARAWTGNGREDADALAARITRDLSACRIAFEKSLGRTPHIFCWPENKAVPEGRRIATDLGYRATTGGKGRNTTSEDPAILSRIHMGDRAIGFRWQPAEALHFHAAVRLMQGNHYWYLVLLPMHAARRLILRLRVLFGDDFA